MPTIHEKIEQIRAETIEGANTCERVADVLDDLLNLAESGIASIDVHSVVTGLPGSAAKVENKGTSKDVLLKFTIPAGATGDRGTSATVQIDEVITGEPNTPALVENVGTETNVRLKITIPRGKDGTTGGGTSGGFVLPALNVSLIDDTPFPPPEEIPGRLERQYVNITIGAIDFTPPEGWDVSIVLLRRGCKKLPTGRKLETKPVIRTGDLKARGWSIPADGQMYYPTRRTIRSIFKFQDGMLVHRATGDSFFAEEFLKDWTFNSQIWRKGQGGFEIEPTEAYQRAEARFGLAVAAKKNEKVIIGPISQFSIRLTREAIDGTGWRTFTRMLLK